MPIYSQPLGKISITDSGTIHDVYDVPVSAGPAIVRSVSFYGDAGVHVELYAFDGATRYLMCDLDNTGGAVGVTKTVTLYQPLEPGWSIQAYNAGGSGFWTVINGGYQFSVP